MNENVNVCITPKGDKPVLHFSQFDNERVFTVTVLADDGESAAVLTGLDIEFRIRKTDSHVVTIAPESVADNVITFKTTEQMCACCGQNIATVTLMKDDMIISTLDILVDIQRDILSGGLTSESDIRNLTTQIEQIVPEVVGDDYYTKTEVDDLIDDIPTFDPTNYYDKSAVDGLLADKADADDVYTKTETDNLLADKADSDDVMVKITRHGLGGDVAYFTFDNNCVSPMDNIECAVEAVQDLHGYSKPWSGGCGKNKLNATTTIAYMTLVDGVYTITSLPQNGASWSIGQADLKAGTYILNGGVNANYRCYVQVGGEYYTSSGADVSFTLTSDTLLSVIGVIMPSATVGQKMKPMIRKTGESADFEPYSNICPISGQSSCTITVADSDDTSVNTCTVSFGQTVYGGVADVTNGKVTVTHGLITLNGSETWIQSGNSAYINNTDAKIVNEYGNGISDQYEFGTWGDVTGAGSYGKFTIYKYTAWTAARIAFALGTLSLADFKTALSNTPVTICYELDTPVEITFTPATTDTINGTNKVSSSTGNMKSLTYFSDVNSDLVDLIRACMI